MLNVFRRTAALLLCLCLVLPLISAAQAEETTPQTQLAEDISSAQHITEHNGFYKSHLLFDKDTAEFCYAGRDAWMTLEHESGIGSMYLIFDIEYGPYTVTNNDTGAVLNCGENNFLHDFLDLEAAFGTAPKSVTVTFTNEELYLNELYLFTPGQVPDFVQRWDLPKENETDLILFSTHGDDEQLFFAGILPYYAKELGYEVLVVYLTDHQNLTRTRAHEMLNGLWAVGVRTYPILGSFPDFHVKELNAAYSIFLNQGYTEEDITRYVVENIRRFKPKVAIGHDPLGEYSHGQHMVYSDVLQKAVQRTMDPEYFPESAEKYGVWDVPKTYLHLYTENQIWMDWDQPLESFDGMTAFEVTRDIGFPCHKSQIIYFAWYMSYVDTAAEVPLYSPCEYGLFRSTVGDDVAKNDFFENVTTYAQDKEKAEAEAAAKAEAERLAAEEEAKRKQEEEERRLEAERLAKEEEARLEAERIAQEQAAQKKMLILIAAAGIVALILIVVILVMVIRRKR